MPCGSPKLLDHIVLFSGDGDFRSLVAALQQMGKRVSGRLHAADAAADGRRRAAPPGRPVHRPCRPRAADLPRSSGTRGARRPPVCRPRPGAGCRARPPTRTATTSPKRSKRQPIPAGGGAAWQRRSRPAAQRSRRGFAGCARASSSSAPATRSRRPDWFNGAVPSFGEETARLLIVGLAPGLNGANRTGRPFTGDFAGELLYATLLEFGFAQGRYAARSERWPASRRLHDHQRGPLRAAGEQADARRDHDLLPLPAGPHRASCPISWRSWRWGASLTTARSRRSASASRSFPFAHGARHALPSGLVLFDSFHCSRYNTNTRQAHPRYVQGGVCGRARAAPGHACPRGRAARRRSPTRPALIAQTRYSASALF